jgi:WD40 repeat protein
VKSDGTEGLSAAQQAAPSPIDPTRTRTREPLPAATPAPAPADPPAVPQLRDPTRYHILGEHGRGGLGRVSRAHDRELGRDIAIKELISRGHLSEVRFLREALITARLEHPGIVPVYEAGRWADGTPFYAMKLVAGRSLRDLLAERTTVDERIALLHHVIAVADAIAYAHGRNIIHRDLKPSNVIVGDFGETVVIDWGLAKDITTTEPSYPGGGPFRANPDDGLTSAGSVLGTPAYMAPEQERGEHVDQRADVYAIGAMLWELCSLDKLPPSYARQRHRLLRKAGIDPDLATIITKALDPDPAHRYPDAAALAADLKAFKAGARIAARRYSVLGMLTHWVRRHRTLAGSLIAALTVAVVGVSLYVHNIAIERDRADAALISMQMQTRQAVIANATSLLDRDPTQAWAAMSALSGPTPETALLRARIKAAGIADTTLQLPTRLDEMDLTPSGSHLIVSTLDRSMFDIDLKAQSIRRLADGVTEPAVFAVTNTDVYMVRDAVRLKLVRVSITSRQQQELIDLPQLPEALMASEAGVYWQYADGTVQQLSQDGSVRTIATDATQFAPMNSTLAVCSKTHVLRVGEHGRTGAPIGRCANSWAWALGPDSFALPVDASHVGLYQNGHFRYIDLETGPLQLGLSETGLISVIDTSGNGAYRLPGSSSFQRIGLGQRPIGTKARGSFAVWSFRDGSVRVLDTNTRREWSIRAHAHGIFCAYLLPPGDRLVTCGHSEIRIWKLSHDAPTLVTDLPGQAFNIALDSDGTALFDGAEGDVCTIRQHSSRATVLHKHNLLSFGIAWCGKRACSASWDGRLLCSVLDPLSTDIVADFGRPIRWLGGSGDSCFLAVSNGGIYDLRSPTDPIYRHDHEPYRLALSPDATLLASTDWAGAVKIWNLKERRLFADLSQLHHGLVIGAMWIDNTRIVTAGYDGFIYLLTRDLHVQRSWRLGAAVRYIAVTKDSIVAALGNGMIWNSALEGGAERTLPLGVTFTALSVSQDKFIAVGTNDGDVFIVDPFFRIKIQHFQNNMIRCMTFETPRTLLACLSDKRVVRVTVSSESFEQ